ncbi:MAG TPA: TlpA disulfide reductase family protein [Nevskiaceae bacterium]|nr:TlpA disulfide reductase family protein [Nevskiaceae bacterium]
MSVRGTIAAILVAAIAGAAGFLTYQRGHLRNTPVPDLTLIDLDGQTHHLSEYRGKLTLVNFWASWCAPCIQEIPMLVKAQSQYAARGFQVIGPAMDSRQPVLDAMKRFGINYPVYGSEDEVTKAMDALGDDGGVLPYSVLISADGKVLERFAGGLSQAKLDGLLAKYLAP